MFEEEVGVGPSRESIAALDEWFERRHPSVTAESSGWGVAAGARSARAAPGAVVIHVLAERPALHGGEGAAPGSAVCADGLISPELLTEIAAAANKVPLIHPGDAPPEPGYVPSKALADFVRCRDLTCRWPGCDRPAFDCELDHTIPHARGGPTHAANLKCLCTTHHLIKTFAGGPGGWQDQQFADGTGIPSEIHPRVRVSATRVGCCSFGPDPARHRLGEPQPSVGRWSACRNLVTGTRYPARCESFVSLERRRSEMTDKWFSDIPAPGELTLADLCDQIEQKIHANADNQKLPQEFPDWQSCMEDRDATIYKLSAAVVNLCQMVEFLASEQQRSSAST